MFRRIIVLIGISLCCLGNAVGSLPASCNNQINAHKYETARILIEKAIPDTKDECGAYFALSKISANIMEYQKAYSYFKKCINHMPAPSNTEVRNIDVERKLEVAAVFRLRNIWSVSEAILDALSLTNENYSSIYYERAYTYLSQDNHEGFISNYYEGYRLNPENPRRWAGLAVINSINQSPPIPEHFYWLRAAAFQYDNPALWGYVMQTLEKHNLLQDANIHSFADGLPGDIKPIFYYYYYRKTSRPEDAADAIQEMYASPKDARRVFFIAYLASVSGIARTNKVATNAESKGDFCELIYYYNYWLSYWEHHEWTSNTLTYYTNFVRDAGIFLSETLQEGEARVKYNEIINWVVIALIRQTRQRAAIEILSSSIKALDKTNREILVLLYKNANADEKAVHVIEGICKQYPDEDATQGWLVEQALLQRDTPRVRRYVSLNYCFNDSDVVSEYLRLTETKIGVDMSKAVIEIPDVYNVSTNSDWRDWEKIGPCAIHSVISILSFWGSGESKYHDIEKSLMERAANGDKESIDAIETYFGSHGYKTYIIPPIKAVMKHLLHAHVPLIVFGFRSIGGLNTGHSSVAYGYDDFQKLFFLKDTSSGIGESSVTYDSVVEARSILVAIPNNRDIGEELDLAKIDAIARKTIIEKTEIGEMEDKFPGISRWCYFHNGESLFKISDANSLKYFEKTLNGKKPRSNIIYSYLAIICRHEQDNQKALQYIQGGLLLYPDLKLLEEKIRTRMAQIKSKGGLTVTTVKELLEVTKKMERLNSEYPETYFLRGDIYAKYTENYDYIINAFVSYLRMAAQMGSQWQKKYDPSIEHAQNAIVIFKRAILKKLEE